MLIIQGEVRCWPVCDSCGRPASGYLFTQAGEGRETLCVGCAERAWRGGDPATIHGGGAS